MRLGNHIADIKSIYYFLSIKNNKAFNSNNKAFNSNNKEFNSNITSFNNNKVFDKIRVLFNYRETQNKSIDPTGPSISAQMSGNVETNFDIFPRLRSSMTAESSAATHLSCRR